MLALRVIPCLDVKDGRVVKGVNFLELRDAGDPVEQARNYDREGADEITFLDITKNCPVVQLVKLTTLGKLCFYLLRLRSCLRHLSTFEP